MRQQYAFVGRQTDIHQIVQPRIVKDLRPVVDVEIAQLCQLGSEFVVVLLFTLVESKVLDQQEASRFQLLAGLLNRFPDGFKTAAIEAFLPRYEKQ